MTTENGMWCRDVAPKKGLSPLVARCYLHGCDCFTYDLNQQTTLVELVHSESANNSRLSLGKVLDSLTLEI